MAGDNLRARDWSAGLDKGVVKTYLVVHPSVISARLSVCRLSVTFVRPTQAIEIFGNVSTPFGTLAIC